MSFGHAKVTIEPAPACGPFTILLVGDSPRHQYIADTLADVSGVVVVRHYTDREPGTRIGKGERKRNKAMRWA